MKILRTYTSIPKFSRVKNNFTFQEFFSKKAIILVEIQFAKQFKSKLFVTNFPLFISKLSTFCFTLANESSYQFFQGCHTRSVFNQQNYEIFLPLENVFKDKKLSRFGTVNIVRKYFMTFSNMITSEVFKKTFSYFIKCTNMVHIHV